MAFSYELIISIEFEPEHNLQWKNNFQTVGPSVESTQNKSQNIQQKEQMNYIF